MSLVDAIDALLPQTQCGECGYPGCRPYAQAMAQKQAPIDQCPPGGVNTLTALATVLQQDPTPYLDSVKANTRPPALALIREAECIGCTKCIQACPVDAILGSSKRMHSIIGDECTGCGLCIEPCPVDCIDLIPLEKPSYDRALAKNRFEARNIRQLKEAQAKEQVYREKRELAAQSEDNQADNQAKQAYILEALARVSAKKS